MNARGVRKIVDESIAIKQTYVRDCTVLVGNCKPLEAYNIIPHAAQAVRPGKLRFWDCSAVVDSVGADWIGIGPSSGLGEIRG